jgi:hypothetical protein
MRVEVEAMEKVLEWESALESVLETGEGYWREPLRAS